MLLLLVSLFMFYGYLRADLSVEPAAAILFFLIIVLAPAAAGGLLLRSWFTRRKNMKRRREGLRRQTLESEVLKLARTREGSLTALDLVTNLGISRDEADSVLDAFAVRGVADTEISDSGVLIYTFIELKDLQEQRSVGESRRR